MYTPKHIRTDNSKYISYIHNQGNKNNCTAHSFAGLIEVELTEKFGEFVYVDVDDLWEKQKNLGPQTKNMVTHSKARGSLRKNME